MSLIKIQPAAKVSIQHSFYSTPFYREHNLFSYSQLQSPVAVSGLSVEFSGSDSISLRTDNGTSLVSNITSNQSLSFTLWT